MTDSASWLDLFHIYKEDDPNGLFTKLRPASHEVQWIRGLKEKSTRFFEAYMFMIKTLKDLVKSGDLVEFHNLIVEVDPSELGEALLMDIFTLALQEGHLQICEYLLRRGYKFGNKESVDELFFRVLSSLAHTSNLRYTPIRRNRRDIRAAAMPQVNVTSAGLQEALRMGESLYMESKDIFGQAFPTKFDELLSYYDDQDKLFHSPFPPHLVTMWIIDRLNGDVNALRTEDGFTLLHIACMGGLYRTSRILVACGADVNAIANDSSTPLSLAMDAYADLACFAQGDILDNVSTFQEVAKSLTEAKALGYWLMSLDACEDWEEAFTKGSIKVAKPVDFCGTSIQSSAATVVRPHFSRASGIFSKASGKV